MSTLRYLYVVVLILHASTASARPVYMHPPFLEYKIGMQDDMEANNMIDNDYLNMSGVQINVTSFDEVIDIFGESVLYRLFELAPYRPVEEGAEEALCYKSEHDDIAVIFISGAIGGWRIINQFWIGNIALIYADKCAVSEFIDSEKMAVNGLSLGINEVDVKAMLGKPSYSEASDKSAYFKYSYYYDGSYNGDEELKADWIGGGYSGFEFGFNERKLYWFTIYKYILWEEDCQTC